MSFFILSARGLRSDFISRPQLFKFLLSHKTYILHAELETTVLKGACCAALPNCLKGDTSA